MSKKDEDRKAAEERAKDTRDRIKAGEKIDKIIAQRQAAISRQLLKKALKEK